MAAPIVKVPGVYCSYGFLPPHGWICLVFYWNLYFEETFSSLVFCRFVTWQNSWTFQWKNFIESQVTLNPRPFKSASLQHQSVQENFLCPDHCPLKSPEWWPGESPGNPAITTEWAETESNAVSYSIHRRGGAHCRITKAPTSETFAQRIATPTAI